MKKRAKFSTNIKRQIKDGKVETSDKGRKMAKGKCPVCGTNVTRFLPKEGA